MNNRNIFLPCHDYGPYAFSLGAPGEQSVNSKHETLICSCVISACVQRGLEFLIHSGRGDDAGR